MRNRFPRFPASASRFWRAALLTAVLAGCDADAVSPDRAAALRSVAGADQAALPGETLPEPLRVRVEDAAGNPVRGAVVQWTVALGGGALDVAQSETDGEGYASVVWTLGAASGEQRVEARVPGAAPVIFGALATEVAEFRLSPRVARLAAPGDELVLRLLTRGAEGGDVASGVVTWHSSDPRVATVFGGRIRAVGRGATTIIASGDGVADTMLLSVGIAANEAIVVTGTGEQRTSASEVRIQGTAAGNGLAGYSWMEWGRQPDLSDAVQVMYDTLPATSTRSISYTVTGLALGETIYFRAVGQNASGTVHGAIVSYTVAAPAVPTGVAATIGPPNFLVKVTWTVPERGVTYAVERREPGQAEWTSSPLYSSNPGGYWAEYPSMLVTRTVEYRVKSCNLVGCTHSAPVSLVIPRLEPAQNLAASVTDSGFVRLTWTDASHETSWRVTRRIEGSDDPEQLLATLPAGTTQYVDRSLPLPGATYLYTVRAQLSFGGRTSLPTPEVAATPGTGETYPPIVTTGTGVQPTNPGSVTLRGTVNGNNFPATAWIEWSHDPTLATYTATGSISVPDSVTLSYGATVTGQSAGSTLYFRAVAQNPYGTVRGAVASYTVAPPLPTTDLTLVFAAPEYRTRLTWTPGERTARYAVEQRSHPDSAWSNPPLYTTPGGQWTEYPSMTVSRTIEYRVRSCNALGCVHSNVVSLPITGLLPPQGLTATPNAANDVVLSWNAGGETRQTNFEVHRRLQGQPAPGTMVAQTLGTTTTWTDTSTLAGYTYVYAVRARLNPAARNSPFSSEVTVTPGAGTTYPPTANTGTAFQPLPSVGGAPDRATLRGSAYGNNFAGESWFEWSTSPTLAGAQEVGRGAMPATGGRQMSAVVTGLSAGTTIYFRTAAQNQYGIRYGSIGSYTLGAPGVPTGLAAQYGAPTFRTTLTWTPGERTVGYAVQQRDQGQTTWTSTSMYTSNPGGTWSGYPGVNVTRFVEYRVESCNGGGCAYSGIVSVFVEQMNPPSGLTASVNVSRDVVLSWTDNTSMETSYHVLRRLAGSTGALSQIATVGKDVTSYVDTTPSAGVAYEYYVRAGISYGNRQSAYSDPVTVTP